MRELLAVKLVMILRLALSILTNPVLKLAVLSVHLTHLCQRVLFTDNQLKKTAAVPLESKEVILLRLASIFQASMLSKKLFASKRFTRQLLRHARLLPELDKRFSMLPVHSSASLMMSLTLPLLLSDAALLLLISLRM